ncbi:MAG: hypothetical protein WC465_03450 [Patescibacteria group bacterium]
MFRNKSAGFSLVELLVAISFVGVIIVAIFNISSFNSSIRRLNEERTQALFYAVEGIEASKLISWENLVIGDHGLVQQDGTWALAANEPLLDNRFSRVVTVSDVYRTDVENGNVYGLMGGSQNIDPDTKKITVTISWLSRTGRQRQEQLETYVYRFQASRWSQENWVGGTGQVDWSDDTKFYSKNAGIDVTIPGVSTLIAGFLNWNNATTTAFYNTPGSSDDNDVYETDGIAYVVTENNSSGSEFYVLNISDIRDPQPLGSLNIGTGVTAVMVQGNFAYVSTRSDGAEFQVIDVADPHNLHVEVTRNLSGSSDARDIVVNNTQAYIIQGSTLYAFNITNPSNPTQYSHTLSVSATGNELFVSGNYVYVATEDSSKELQIVDITNPANMFLAGQYDLSGSLRATDVNVRGTRAYVSTKVNYSGPEFFIFNIEDPISPELIGQYEVGADINAFGIVGPYALLGTAISTEELRVIDISFPSTINKVSGFDLFGSILGMSANCAVIYAATTGDLGEFAIISTEDTDCQYASAGMLESSTFDTGTSTVAYNWIRWSGLEPLGTNIKFQIATSQNQAGPWNFLGPDGSSNTYYTNASQEYINYQSHLNQRYLRYRLYLDTSSELQVPILEDVTISYSIYP